MILLLTWLTLIEVLPEDGLLLQTYSTDNIGRQNFFFSLGTSGYSYQSLGYEENMILNLRQHELRIAVPFWIRFFDEYFHFYSLPKMLFTHPFCNFMPSEIIFDPIEVFTVKNAHLYVQNMRLNEVMIINEIVTNSKNIFIPQLRIIRVMPGNVVFYSIYICPTEPGNFQDIIFVKTNFGTVPYSISYQAYKTQDDTLTPVLIHHYAQDEINISISVPSEIANLKKSIIFDSSVFDSSRVLITNKNVYIGSSSLITSSYITFVHILTAHLKYTFPITILSSPKPLQHIYPIIVIPPITKRGETSQVEIIIVNPTDEVFEINFVSLRNFHYNVKLIKIQQPIIAPKNSKTVVGQIVATGDREGEITGSVHINYMNRQNPVKYEMLIPVKGCILFGSLTFSEKDISLLSNSTRKFTMINNFSVPIAIFGINPDSPYFTISEFEPFLLLPGQRSPDIKVMFNYTSSEVNCDTKITIVTNITSFSIRAHGLTGKITISDPKRTHQASNFRRSLLQEDLGSRFCNSVENFTFIIKNPNPVEFAVYKVKTTCGIRVTCEKEFVVKAESEYVLNVLVLYKKMSEKKRSDQITFYGTGKSLLVTFSWVPVHGKINITCYFKQTVYYGYCYLTNLSVVSSYKSNFVVDNIISVDPSNSTRFDLINDTIEIIPEQTVPIGNVTFILDQQFIQGTRFEHLLEHERNLKSFLDNWENDSCPTKLYLYLRIGPDYFLRAKLKFDVDFSKPDDIELNIGKVVIGSYKNTTIAIPNQFFTSVRYLIFDNEDVKFEDTEFTLETDSIAIVDFLFHGKVLGTITANIPILSNTSSPFLAKITATVVDIKINVHPKELYFEPTSLFQRPIKKTVYVTNKGDTDILLNNFTTKPVGSKAKFVPFKFESNCTIILHSNCTCLVVLTANNWQLYNASFDFFVQSHLTRKTVRLRSTVGESFHWKVVLIKKVAWNSLLLLALAYPIYLIARAFISMSHNKKLFDLKLKELPDEIDKLSAAKSSMFSVATQASGPADASGGSWVQIHNEHEVDVPVPRDIIDALRTALKKIE